MNNPFPSLDLRHLAIRDQLLAIYHKGIWWASIENAVMNNTHPLRKVAEMIIDQYEDDPNEVLTVVPQETIDLIKAVYYA